MSKSQLEDLGIINEQRGLAEQEVICVKEQWTVVQSLAKLQENELLKNRKIIF